MFYQICIIECCGALSDSTILCTILCYLHIILLACFPIFRKKVRLCCYFLSVCVPTYLLFSTVERNYYYCYYFYLFFFLILVLRNLRLLQPQSKAPSQNCEKQLLTSSCLSVHPSVRPSVSTEQLDSRWTDFR